MYNIMERTRAIQMTQAVPLTSSTVVLHVLMQTFIVQQPIAALNVILAVVHTKMLAEKHPFTRIAVMLLR